MGQIGLGLAGDANGNNQIKPGKYAVWRIHFGQTAGSGAALPSDESLSAAVPEPATLILIIMAPIGWRLRRRLDRIEMSQQLINA